MTIQFKVVSTEIIDNASPDSDGCIHPSEISALVNVEVDGKVYSLDFQATTTHDYGAFSSKLESYDGDSCHCDLERYVNDEEA